MNHEATKSTKNKEDRTKKGIVDTLQFGVGGSFLNYFVFLRVLRAFVVNIIAL